MKKNKRILFILESYYPNIGGVETLFKNLCEQFVLNGFEVKVITAASHKSSPKLDCINGVEVERLSSKSRYIFTFLAFFKAIKYASNFDLIHTTSYNAAIPAFFVGLVTRKRVVITFHEVWDKLWFQLPFLNTLQKLSYSLYERFVLSLPFYKYIAVSEYTRESLMGAGIKGEKIEMIYNGIDYKYIQRIAKSSKIEKQHDFKYMYFGRLGVSKGLDLLLPASKIVNEKIPNAKLLLVIPKNNGTISKYIYKYIRENNLEKSIDIKNHLGYSELISEVLSSRCVVIPSYSEGFGFNAVEVSALGVPIVHSGLGSLDEVVSGSFVRYSSQTPKSLAEAIIKVNSGDLEKKELKKFELLESIEKYEEFYEEIITP